MPIENPTNALDFDNIRWYLMHENIVVFVDKDQWYIGFMTRCKNLQPDNRCGVYETRPRICRSYTTDNCDFHGAEYGYEHLFTSSEQLREFAEIVLGKSLIVKPRKTKKKRRVVKEVKIKKRDGKKTVRLNVMK